MKAPICELCHEEASLYCASDSAFLCFSCDSTVHLANFLVARHVRHPLCSKCNRLNDHCIDSDAFYSLPSTCESCLRHEKNKSGSSSSACSSTTSATAPKNIEGGNRQGIDKIGLSSCVTDTSSFSARSSGDIISKTTRSRAISLTDVDRKAEVIFTTWCRKLDLNSSESIVAMALQALAICSGRMRGLPVRVYLAAVLWLGLRLCEGESFHTRHNLKRVEEITGVPAKLLIGAEAKLGRTLRERSGPRDLEESWAENSD